MSGELDLTTADFLRNATDALIDCKQAAVIDLKEVPFCDLRGLAPILEALRATADGQVISLRNPPESVRRLIDVLPLLSVQAVPGTR